MNSRKCPFRRAAIVFAFSITIFAGCGSNEPGPGDPGWVDTDRLLNADNELENWMSLGRDFQQQHYSPADQINVENVSDLGLAWEYDARTPRGRVNRGLEAVPIVVDGIMYTSGAWSIVYALDARTGDEIWTYDPEVDGAFARAECCDIVNRGVQVWKGRVYVATFDGYLVALDARSGLVLWRVDTLIDRTRGYSITGAPQIAGNVIVIGNGGADFGVRGYITAYDLTTGGEEWRFFTVPGDPENGYEHRELEMAAETWDPDSDWESGGGGTVWGQFAYDPYLNLLYVGTGNSTPYPIWFRSPSGGDNLFLASILAINPDTGALVWYYQTTPGEMWDYTVTQNLVLADLEIDGSSRQVLMVAPKNGFLYVLDRQTGELLTADNFVRVTWATHIDMDSGRPVLTEQGNYQDEPKWVYPWDIGAHSWQQMSYSPQTELVYIPAIDAGMLYTSFDEYSFQPGEWNVGIYYLADSLKSELLIARDPVTQEEIWSVELQGVGNGGVLSTGGNLVFQGNANGNFVAYRADTGKILHQIPTGTGIMAAPITYVIDGEQYVAVMAGFGGALLDYFVKENAAATYENFGRILAFKLSGTDVALPPERVIPDISEPPIRSVTAESIQKGGQLYGEFCAVCHGGIGGERMSLFPSLIRMASSTHELFNQILLEGLYEPNGMANWSDILMEEDAEAIHDYLVSEQESAWREQENQN
ncbi:MAG: hypothetical protein BMS9Abin05_2497 [Rhodothermia bacterium]|nr:MAG: hypothetical protein BMS9Abin05_2497 [Rhodothermia bacterium]